MSKSRRKKDNKNKSLKKFWEILFLLTGLLAWLYPKRKKIKKIVENEKNKYVNVIEKEYNISKHQGKKFSHRILRFLKDIFIPHEGNNHRPKALHPKSLKVYVILLVLIKLFVTGFIFFTYPNPARLSEKIVNEVFLLTNESRQSEGINKLTWNDSLARAAQSKAQDMINNNYFSHISPDGTQPWQWINKGEYNYVYMGENLAMDFSSAQIVHSAFKKSPTHWKNIMNSKYSDMGIGLAVGKINGKETIVLAEFFGSEKTPAPQLVKVAKAAETKNQIPNVTTSQEKQISIQEVKTTPVVKETIPSVETEIKKDITPSTVVKSFDDTSKSSVISNTNITENTNKAESKNIIIDKKEVATVADKEIAYQPIAQKLVPEITTPKIFTAANELQVVPIEENQIKKGMVDYVILYGRYILLLFLFILMAILLVNILVKPHIQHSAVILQTLALIVIVSAFLFVRFNFIEDLGAVIIY